MATFHDFWANPFVHLVLLKSSMAKYIYVNTVTQNFFIKTFLASVPTCNSTSNSYFHFCIIDDGTYLGTSKEGDLFSSNIETTTTTAIQFSNGTSNYEIASVYALKKLWMEATTVVGWVFGNGRGTKFLTVIVWIWALPTGKWNLNSVKGSLKYNW